MDQEQILKNFGERVRKLRLEKNLTQIALAEKMGSSEPGISRAESGKHNPTLMWILKLADALEVKPSELIDYLKPSK